MKRRNNNNEEKKNKIDYFPKMKCNITKTEKDEGRKEKLEMRRVKPLKRNKIERCQ